MLRVTDKICVRKQVVLVSMNLSTPENSTIHRSEISTHHAEYSTMLFDETTLRVNILAGIGLYIVEVKIHGRYLIKFYVLGWVRGKGFPLTGIGLVNMTPKHHRGLADSR